MSLRRTTPEFIANARRVHGDKYDYGGSNYLGRLHGVSIRCPKPGVFFQVASEHLRGRGCKQCAVDERSMRTIKKHSLIFSTKASLIHDNKYDYTKSIYTGVFNSLTITCPIHGDFTQTPRDHLSGCGCIECGNIVSRTNSIKDVSTFIDDANDVHEHKYDYSKVEYKNNYTKILIICPDHGEFWQTPSNHTNGGNGCPACTETGGERSIREFLQHHNVEFVPQYRFDECKDVHTLPFDFYLPELNICIEFDGIQHFEAIPYFGGENALTLIQKHDIIKNKYCGECGISLIRISHLEIKLIDRILEEKLLCAELQSQEVKIQENLQ